LDGLPPIADKPDIVLSQQQKAAVVVQVLLSEGAKLSLSRLPEDLQAELTYQIGKMPRLDKATINAALEEFAQELAGSGMHMSGGLEQALTLLDGSISASTSARLRAKSGLTAMGDAWPRISNKSNDVLLPFLESESIEVAAVLLSKLKVSQAAELLGLIPGERARRITYAVSRINTVAPDAVRRIGHSLAEQMETETVHAFEDGPVERVGAILNFSRATTRDDVLEGLEETDTEFAKEVRKAIFTFANIPERLDARDVPKVVRQVDQEVLVKAVAAARGEHEAVSEFILGAMSQRMADAIRGDVEDVGEISEEDGEEAMGAVVNAIRQASDDGEIFLISPGD
jgi:flagellar motor switch protein FliG